VGETAKLKDQTKECDSFLLNFTSPVLGLSYLSRTSLSDSQHSLMAIFTAPRSFHNVNAIAPQAPMGISRFMPTAHESHPPFFQLVLLVFEAVLEVVCVSLPGYIAARQGMFDADAQKLVANLNVTLFTPCLSMDPLPSPCLGFES
jgi:hypothetical protein